MGKLNQNFTTWKGNYREVNFLIEDVATVEGCEAEWACSETVNSVKEITKSSESNPAGITFSGKTVKVILNPSDTASMDAGDYYHELRLIDTSLNPSTPAIGTMTLKEVILTGS
jgi:hydroxyethylthiazole kinase-like sugar kinase family protein